MRKIKGFVSVISLAIAACMVIGATQAASAANRVVRIHNQAGQSVWHLYIVTPNTDGWLKDVLGDDTLDNNEYFDVNVYNGTPACIYDFKFVMADGSVETKMAYNVCTQSDLYTVP